VPGYNTHVACCQMIICLHNTQGVYVRSARKLVGGLPRILTSHCSAFNSMPADKRRPGRRGWGTTRGRPCAAPRCRPRNLSWRARCRMPHPPPPRPPPRRYPRLRCPPRPRSPPRRRACVPAVARAATSGGACRRRRRRRHRTCRRRRRRACCRRRRRVCCGGCGCGRRRRARPPRRSACARRCGARATKTVRACPPVPPASVRSWMASAVPGREPDSPRLRSVG